MGFSFEHSGRRQILVYQSEKGYEIDEDIYYMLREDQISAYILPFESSIKKNCCRFEYDITDCINMRAWLAESSDAEKKEISNRMKQAWKFLKEVGIPEKMLVNEVKYTYVDEETGQVQIMCIPLKEKTVKEKRGLFGRKTSRREEPLDMPPLPETPPVPRDDTEWLEDYGQSPKKKTEKFAPLSEEKDQESSDFGFSDMYIRQEKPEDSFLDDYIEESEKVIPKRSERIEEDKFLNDLDNDPEENKFIDRVEQSEEDDDNETVLLADSGAEGTVLLKTIPRINAKLLRERTGECFPVVNKVSKIGKQASKVDIVIRNNNTISREHCILSYDAGKYYLEDNGSLNYTYLNGKQLDPGEKVGLENGCEIQMSDEIFHFVIESS